jgi:hypothetical protein
MYMYIDICNVIHAYRYTHTCTSMLIGLQPRRDDVLGNLSALLRRDNIKFSCQQQQQQLAAAS